MKQRVVSGIIAGAAFIGLLLVGGYWFAGLILVLSLLGYHEFIRMNKFKTGGLLSLGGFAVIVMITPPWAALNILESNYFEEIVWFFVLFLLVLTVLSKNRINIKVMGILLIGVLYIGLGFRYMIEIRLLDHGLFWSLLLFICIWATDSGAYFMGRAFGKHLLWPAISPTKTVEGALGGFLFSIAAALMFSLFSPDLLNIYSAVIIAVVVSVAGQIGDLIQSAYKRVYGVKDSGSLMPGHGGVLDRCDSWLIVFPFIYFLHLI